MKAGQKRLQQNAKCNLPHDILAMNGCPLLQLKQFKLTDILAGSLLKIMS